jgi:glycosyltransferase involved in cell wall biosynthesis
LIQVLERALAMTDAERETYRTRAKERVRARYSWDAVTDAYEKLLTRLAAHKS